MKKGQTEIIGFMVIILLLFFALIFYFKFSASDDTDFLGETELSLEVSNLLTVIKQYSLCEGVSLGDAIKTCAQGGGFVCDVDACDTVQQEVAQITSLDGWEETSYMFYIGDVLYSSRTCAGNTLAEGYTTAGIDVRLVYCY
ncbi:hypothetical protein EXS74_03120 [Candidatus Woesearchaeota archaeon]|nr:hypothetical protein [Candidatus Woesearchaeota archaeon]